MVKLEVICLYGIFLGIAVYILFFSKTIVKISVKIILFFKKIICSIFNILTYPLKILIIPIKNVVKKCHKLKIKFIKEKKIENKEGF